MFSKWTNRDAPRCLYRCEGDQRYCPPDYSLGMHFLASSRSSVHFSRVRQFAVSAWRIWNSVQEGLDEIATLRLISEDILAVTQKLSEESSSSSRLEENESSKRTLELAQRCGKVAQQMLDTLDGLKLPRTKRQKRQSKAHSVVLVRDEEK